MYYWRMGVGGGRRSFLGLRLVSAIWYCLLYQGLLKPVYTQVLKEGLGPKSELKPMGVTYKPICMSEPHSVSVPLNMCSWSPLHLEMRSSLLARHRSLMH